MRSLSAILSVRRMMALVAAVAFLLWAVTVGWRWAESERLAEEHERTGRGLDSQAATLRFYAEAHRSRGEPVPASMLADIRDREAGRDEQMRIVRRYRRAAASPWRAGPRP